jgi:hypothetical protein
MRIDMHVHTIASDGELTFQELVDASNKLGLDGLVVTDHDLWSGVVDDRIPIDIGGVEFTTRYAGLEFHLLGYFRLSHFHKELELFLKEQQELWSKVVEALFQKAADEGFRVEESWPKDWYGFRLLHESIGKKLGLNGPAVYRDFFVQGKVLKPDTSKYPPIQDVIRLVRKCGGMPVLAHPMAHIHRIDVITMILKALKNVGLVGVEVYTPQHNKSHIIELEYQARRENLLITGGSDFHTRDWDTQQRQDGRGVFGLACAEPWDVEAWLKYWDASG